MDAEPGPAVDHPRIRGEHIRLCMPEGSRKGSSPHTRGAHQERPRGGHQCGIIPAYAGSTSRVLTRLEEGGWIIPAYAGSTAGPADPTGPDPDHPRIRGEHDARSVQGPSDTGSSPHTRGAPGVEPGRRVQCGIIPAYAGSTRPGSSRPAAPSDHPRIRGEHTLHPQWVTDLAGSSPHTRGALGWPSLSLSDSRIIPAYAGSTSRRAA